MRVETITVESSAVPTVEIDTAVRAAYIRFSNEKVAKTISDNRPGVVVAIDLNAKGKVIGIELIGVSDFSIETLLKLARAKAPRSDLSQTRYVKAGEPVPV